MLRFFKRQRKRKVLVVGLDCAPPSVLFKTGGEESLGLKDQLPNLSRLIDEGIYGPLSSSIPCITVPAWTARTGVPSGAAMPTPSRSVVV